MTSYHKHYHKREHTGICVIRRKGEDGESLLKRFRKKYSKSGISKELRDRMYYEKPSNKRRRKKAQSIRLKRTEEKKLEKMEARSIKMRQKRAKIARKKEKKGASDDSSNIRQNSS